MPAVVVAFALASPAAADSITLTLSDLSSEPGTNPASELDARITFDWDGAYPGQLTVTVFNDTNSGTPSQLDPAYNIREVYFNLTSDILSVSLFSGPANWSGDFDACPTNSGTTAVSPCDDMGGQDTKADGFGIFDVALTTGPPGPGNPIAAGGSETFVFDVTAAGGATVSASDFTSELSRDSEAGGLILSQAAARFTNRNPLLPDPDSGLDSAFGNVPEPSTAALLGLGLVGLARASRRRIQAELVSRYGTPQGPGPR